MLANMVGVKTLTSIPRMNHHVLGKASFATFFLLRKYTDFRRVWWPVYLAT